jgi:hypothetical protein
LKSRSIDTESREAVRKEEHESRNQALVCRNIVHGENATFPRHQGAEFAEER